MAIGTVLATITAVLAIIKQIQDIINQTDETLDSVNKTLRMLTDESEGGFVDALKEGEHWLEKQFRNLINSMEKLMDHMREDMEAKERVDNEDSGTLKGAKVHS